MTEAEIEDAALDHFRALGYRTPEMETAIRQLVDEAVTGEGVVDVYRLAGIEPPELSILSDEFLDGLATKDEPNLQMGLLRRLLTDLVRTVRRTNVVQGRRFSEQLDEAINRYTNRARTTAEKEMRDQAQRHESLGWSVAEAACCDTTASNQSAARAMGDEKLKKIPVNLVWTLQQGATIDWNLKDSVKAARRAKVRRLLAKHDYLPDLEDAAVELVLRQAEQYASAA